MTSERFAAVEKNLEAINLGTAPLLREGVSMTTNI